jgi:hypothetical protein
MKGTRNAMTARYPVAVQLQEEPQGRRILVHIILRFAQDLFGWRAQVEPPRICESNKGAFLLEFALWSVSFGMVRWVSFLASTYTSVVTLSRQGKPTLAKQCSVFGYRFVRLLVSWRFGKLEMST